LEPQYDWQTIQSSPEYWDLKPEQRALAKAEYWKRYVEPSEELKAYSPEKQELAKSRFLEPENYVPYERGFIGDVGSRLARGGVGLLESVGGAMRLADADPTQETGIVAKAGKSLADFAERTREGSDFLKPDISEATGAEGVVKRGFGGAVESAIPSLAPLAGTIAGAKAGGLLGTALAGPAGTLPGTIIGGGIGGIGTLFATFGLGQYQTTYDDTVSELTGKGVSPEEADIKARKNALVSATAEAGGELIGDLAAMTFFGVFGGQAAKQPLKLTIKQLLGAGKVGFAKAIAKSVPFEVGSEMGTAYFQAKAAQEAGVSTLPPGEAMAEAVLPAVFLSLMFGGAVHGMNHIEATNIYNGLNSKDPETRIRAAESISLRIKDKEERQQWANIATGYIDSGEQMPLDKPIIDFAIQKKEDDGGKTADIQSATSVDEALKAFEDATRPLAPSIAALTDPLYQDRLQRQGMIDREWGYGPESDIQRQAQFPAQTPEEQAAMEAAIVEQRNKGPREQALKAAGLLQTSGEIPSQGVDEAQQRREVGRAALKYPKPETPTGIAFPETGPTPDRVPPGMERTGAWTHDPVGDYWKGVAAKEGLLESAAEPERDLTEYWANVREKYGLQEETPEPPPVDTSDAEFKAWEQKAQRGLTEEEKAEFAAEIEKASEYKGIISGKGEDGKTVKPAPAGKNVKGIVVEEEFEPTSKDELIEKYRIYEREFDKKIKEHGSVSAAETHALASSGLLQEGVAAARHHLGLPNTMKPGTPLMEREKPTPPIKGPQTKKEKAAKATGVRRGEVGGKMREGEVVITSSGRKTSPFPKVSFGTNRKATLTVRRGEQWLIKEAAEEAKSRGDGFNQRSFEQDIGVKNVPQASKDSAEEYLFGEQPEIPKSILKPLIPKEPIKGPTSKKEKALKEYRDYVAALSTEQREAVSDLIEKEPKRPSGALFKLRKAVDAAKPKKAATEPKAPKTAIPVQDKDLKTIQEITDRIKSIEKQRDELEPPVEHHKFADFEKRLARFTKRHDFLWAKRAKLLSEQKSQKDTPGPETKEPKAPASKPKYGEKNKLFTKDSADAARELLRKKLGQVSTGLDPELVQAGIQLAGYHIEAGARSFGDYAAAMIADLGNAVKPYLRGWYEAVRYYPSFDAKGMTEAADINEKDLTDTKKVINNKEEKEVPDGTLREPTEEPPEGEQAGDVSGTVEGETPGSTLPGPGGRGRKGTSRNDGGRDAGLHGERDRGQEPADNVDYSITPDDALGAGGPKQKYKDNVAAIRVLKDLGPRKATPEEQAILVKYVGWGGLPQAFPKPNGDVSTGWQSEVDELQDVLSSEEYAAARKSTQDAHYTSATVVGKIYDAIKKFGFKQGKILEPAIGTGNFVGLMPASIRSRSSITGIELDPITATIADKLYPKQRIVNSGFESVSIAPGSFDLAIGNPPFGDKKLFDSQHPEFKSFSIHNFFFAKSLVGLRPNGLLSMVVSSSMMDKRGMDQRKWLAGRAELVGAIRLPNTAFKSNAGTEVTTDILFLRKLMDGEQIPDAKWIDLKPIEAEDGTSYLVNEYFADHPEMVLGVPVKNKLHPGEVVDGVYKGVAGFAPNEGVDLGEAIDAAVSFLPKDIYRAGQTVEEVQRPEILVSDVGFSQPYGYTVDDSGNAVRRLPDVNGEHVFEPVLYAGKPLAGKRLEKFKGLLKIRDAVRTLIRAEIADESKATLDRYRKKLNRVYDGFVKKHGYISVPATSKVLNQDPTDLPLLRSLEEKFDSGVSAAVARRTGEKPRGPRANKSSIFTVRTREPYREATTAANAKDGLAIVLREDGYADIDRIAELTGKTVDEAVKDLADIIFKNPVTEGYETSDIYLSGNVKKKLTQAKEARSRDAVYNDNVEALKKVLPKDVPVEKIHFEVGATWIPAQVYEDFSREVLERNATVQYIEDVGVWNIKVEKGISPFDSTRRSAAKIYTDLVTGSDVAVYEYIDKKRVFDREGTVDAQQKAKEINSAFQDWALNDTDRRKIISKNFNDKVNTTIDGKFDGSHMVFPGMGVITTGVKRDDQLMAHQKNVVWRLIQKGKGLVDHVVGSGKTFLSIATGIEMKRMGLLKKPMYVVPNHLVGQWAMDFQRLYPGAKVLVIDKTNFVKSKRQESMGRIATGEWDAVLVAHSSFGFVKMPYEYEKKFYADQIAQYEAAIVALSKSEGKKSRSVKQMENAKDKLKSKMQALANRPKDATVDFSELGVDALFVDEAHEFKNLFYATKRNRVAGLGNQKGSQKAFDMFVKTQFISETNNGRGVFFLTGTPVSNSISEMYTMMRYLEYDRMKEMGIRHFDQWANMFASAVSDWEVDPSGTRYRLQTKMDFVNVPGLMAFYKDFADVVSTDDLQKWAKERGQTWPIPDIKGGKPETVVAEKSDLQKNFMDWIVQRFDNMPSDPKEDNPLKATGEAMKGSLDIRLINPSLPDHPGSKVNLAVKNITATHKKWNARKGTQLVFCDLSVPSKAKGKHTAEIKALQQRIRKLETKLEAETDPEKLSSIEEEYTKLTDKFEKYSPAELMAASSKFSVYDDVKAKLISNGIPENEIAFIHDANTDLQKEDLFSRVRNGRVRVLIGSTSKMGAGMNVQNRLVALHHLDAPWRPSDLEQREGRIIRQGNKFFMEALKKGEKFAVDIFRYATKETLDTRRWQIIERKAKTIEQLRTGNLQWGEVISDTTGAAANAAEMKAASSGNPLILEEIQAKKDLETLEMEKRSDRSKRFGFKNTIEHRDKLEKSYKGDRKTIEKDIKFIENHPRDNTPEGWSVFINEKQYTAKGLISVPKKYEGKDKGEKKANAKAIKDATENNAKALKKAKADFEVGIKKELVPYLVRDLKANLADFTVSIRGIEFDVTRNHYSPTINFEPSIGVAQIFSRALWHSYGPSYDVRDLNSDGLFVEGLIIRLHNAIGSMVNDREVAEQNMKKNREEANREADIADRGLKKPPFDETKIQDARKKHTDILTQLQTESANEPTEVPDFSMWTDQVIERSASPTPTPGYYERAKGPSGEMEWLPAIGSKKIEIYPWVETFVRKKEIGTKNIWSVSEASTGSKFPGSFGTRKAAVSDAKRQLDNVGKDAFLDMIKSHIANIGESPWSTGKPKLSTKTDRRTHPKDPGGAEYTEQTRRSPLTPRLRRKDRRGDTITAKQVAAEFRKMGFGSNIAGDSVTVRTPTGSIAINVADSIVTDDGATISFSYGREAKAGEKVAGSYFNGAIDLKRNLADKFTLSHELFHHMKTAGLFNPAEEALLAKHGDEEAQARWIEGQLRNRKNTRGIAGKLVQKVRDFIDAIVNSFIRTERGILRDVEAGNILQRQGTPNANETQHSTIAGRWQSQMANFLSDKLPGSGSPKQILQTLDSWAKKGLIKSEELEWSGLREWLAEQDGKVGKQDILDFLAANHVQVKEVVKGKQSKYTIDDIENGELEQLEDGTWAVWQGEFAEQVGEGETEQAAIDDAVKTLGIAGMSVDDTKFSQYQEPGGENYKELLLTLPETKQKVEIPKIAETKQGYDDRWFVSDQNGDQISGDGHPTKEGAIEKAKAHIDRYTKEIAPQKSQYKSRHFDEPNVLAHVRFNERTGPDGERVLFIEEIQSDWHQEGRKKGYKGKGLPPGYRVSGSPNDLGRFVVYDSNGVIIPSPRGHATEQEAIAYAVKKIDVPPNAPFKKTWPMLAMKRMVRYAAENGFDQIAWTPGEVQADRYDFSKQIKEIFYRQHSDQSDKYEFKATAHSGETVIEEVGIPLSRIEEISGKEIAEKIKNGKGTDNSAALREWGEQTGVNLNVQAGQEGRVLSGLDLKVGGEGMKGFYDKILPAAANKFFGKKAWGGARVGTAKVAADDTKYTVEKYGEIYRIRQNGVLLHGPGFKSAEAAWSRVEKAQESDLKEVWSLPITPQMRSKALYEGMPMFSTKIIDTLTNEVGSSQLATDIYNFANGLVQSGIKSFKVFTARIYNKFKEVYKKIKPHLKSMWDTLNNQGGYIVLQEGEQKHSYQETLEPVTDQDVIENRKSKRNVKLAAETTIARIGSEMAEGIDKFTGAISTRLGNISKKIKSKIRRLDFDINKKSAADVEAVMPLLKKARKKMTRDDYADWDYVRKNSAIDKINELIDKYGLRTEYDKYREVLTRLRREGLDVGLEIGLIQEYAPRILKDPKGFLTAIGKDPDWGVYSEQIKKRAKELDMDMEDMDIDQKAAIVSNMILGGYSGLGGVPATKERKLKKIPAYLNRFYMDSDGALMRHIYGMRKLIEGRKFFGKIPKKVAEMRRRLRLAETHMRKLQDEMKTASTEDKAKMKKRWNKLFGLKKQYQAYLDKYSMQRDYRQNIGAYVVELIESGEIRPHQERVVNEILNARFHEKGAYGVVQAYKNLSYMDTMGSPISALTQIGDMAWAAFDGGLIKALKHAGRSILKKSRITKEDVGIERIAQEFEDAGSLGKAVSFVFKWVGLEKIDSIGKEALLNTAFEKYKKQAKSNPDKLKSQISEIFEDETDQVIEDLNNDEITDNVKLLVYSRLLDFQPVALSEMPEKYLTAGNGRLFYMLKTFTLKQFDIYRNEIYNKFKNGDRADKVQAIKNLVRLTMFFVIANAGADELKDWVLGRKTDFEDRAVDNMLRLAGVSKFYTWKARTEGIGSATLKLILPPVKFIDSLTKDITKAGDEKGLETVGSIPLVGKWAYWRMGRGVSKRDDLWDIRLRKEKRRLNDIKNRMEEAPNQNAFRQKYNRELSRLRRANALQGRLNNFKQRINRLKKSGGNKADIDRLANKRIDFIKQFLKE